MKKHKKYTIKVFESIELLNHASAELIIAVAEKSIQERGRFTWCLSGGNTPTNLYSLLSHMPYRVNAIWQNTFIFWGDERCVPLNDENNNANIATTILLKIPNLPPSHIFRIPSQLPPQLAAKEYEKILHDFFGSVEPSFDLILLGLGENGHTASLFPHTEVLHEKIKWVKEVFIEEQKMFRITMSAALINKAHHILFLVTGENKSNTLNNILNGTYLPEEYPAQLIGPEHGELLWYIDSAAANKLSFNN